jgi:2-dehydropantoate 2-reductase
MKWCIVGAGAIGGVVGAKLHQVGEDVSLVARGEHLGRIQELGLTLVDPAGSHTLRIPAAPSAAAVGLADGDIVVLAVKTHQTAAVLSELAEAVPSGVRVICAQNGIDNERQASRYFEHVYGANVTLLASHLEPGVVVAHSAPIVGTWQLGSYPVGDDIFVAKVAEILQKGSIAADVSADVMRYKRLKLVGNLANALEIICEPGGGADVVKPMTTEAEACLAAAGLSLPGPDEKVVRPGPVDPSVPRAGGSTLQSVLRSAGTVETDYLNGEVVLLGRLWGVPTPVNALIQRLAREVATGRRPIGSLPEADLLGMLHQ